MYVALLRGVNVGGNNKLSMADLRAALTADGFSDVATYIQSGNIVGSIDEDDVAGRVNEVIARAFNLQIAVVTRTAAEIRQLVADGPIADDDGNKVHVTFFNEASEAAPALAIDQAGYAPERFELRGRDLHLHLPNGMGTSKLAIELNLRLREAGTTRNWNTVSKLAEMAQR